MGLNKGDLRSLVYDIFEIDSFKSKMGDDKNIVVLSFSARTRESAKDLENFLEKDIKTFLQSLFFQRKKKTKIFSPKC